MDTISKRLKDTLKAGMQAGVTYSNEEMRRIILREAGMEYGKDYKETHFAGCVSSLKKSGEIIQIQRGEYVRGSVKSKSADKGREETERAESSETAEETVSMAQVKENILQSVRRELVYLKSVTQNIVLSFDTSEEDIQYMLKVKELLRNLQEFEQRAGA